MLIKKVVNLLSFLQFPVLFLGENQIYDEHKQSLEEALGFLDVFLQDNDFVAGSNLTIADCSLVASVSTIVVCINNTHYIKDYIIK